MRLPPQRPETGREERGRRGEELAAALLAATGHRIVARNLRTRLGEIDLLVRRRRTWIAVEVKARSGHPAPERCVHQAQLDRVGRALRALAPQLRPRPRALRVDVVAVCLTADGRSEVRHFPGLSEAWPNPRADDRSW